MTPRNQQSMRIGGTKAAVRFTRFDKVVFGVVLGLVAAILLTLLMGDRVGVQIRSFSPNATASSTTRIAVQFSEEMDWESVIENLRIDPPITGDYTWTGRILRFAPEEALNPGETYTVTVGAGSQSTSGREVLADTAYNFDIRRPRVAYLSPADSIPQNVWAAVPGDLDSAEQLTFSTSGISSFDVSPDGTRIAYAERNTNTGTSDIKMMSLETGVIQQLTNCPDSDCDSPVWRPDGNIIAYHRVDLNSGLDAIGASPTRVWLIDLSTQPASTRPLFADSQILSYAPQWSADGSRISVYDNNQRGLLIYDFKDDSMGFIPTANGGGDVALSPDGMRVVYPHLIITETQGARTTLDMADLENQRVIQLSHAGEPVDDATTAWHPDGRRLIVARRYIDNRYTRTRQLYLMDTEDLSIEPLIYEPRYFNGYFSWDPLGQMIVMQRFPEMTEDGQPNNNGRPEIWTYHLANDELLQAAENGYFPRWIP
jgi:Tol biopolymer transport system component